MLDFITTRTVYQEWPGATRTTVLVFPHGGMGDRVNLEALLRSELLERRDADRIIMVIPYHAGEYDAHSYPCRADEVWVAQEMGTARQAGEAIAQVVADWFPASELRLLGYFDIEDGIPKPPWNRRPYPRLGELASQGIFPRYPLKARGRWEAATLLAAAGWDPRRPLLAVHARQACAHTPGEPGKNPDLAAMADLLAGLRADTGAQFLILAGKEDLPSVLRPYTLMPIPYDDSLVLAASLLSLCDAFVGGDSGPGHLAAAVGCPIVSIRPPADTWAFGPFAPPERLRVIQGWREPGLDGVAFDPEAARAALLPFLPRDQPLAADAEVQGVPDLPWGTILGLAECPPGTQARIRNGEVAGFSQALEGLLYLLDRGLALAWETAEGADAGYAQACRGRIAPGLVHLFTFLVPPPADPEAKLPCEGLLRAQPWRVAPWLPEGSQLPPAELLLALYRQRPLRPWMQLDAPRAEPALAAFLTTLAGAGLELRLTPSPGLAALVAGLAPEVQACVRVAPPVVMELPGFSLRVAAEVAP